MGVGWMVQRTPFQRSASGTCPILVLYTPTAMQARADVHDTPSSSPPVDPAGCGSGTILQRKPVQRSASVRFLPTLPTAMQARAEAHDTANSAAPGACGVGWMTQRVPSHRSARARVVKEGLV